MNKLSILVLSSLFATGAFAAAHTGSAPMAPNAGTTTPEVQKQGSPKAQAAAESKHNAKSHGTDKSAKQAEVQTAGSAKAQAAAERKHNAKAHTGKKNSTDERQAQDLKKN